MRSNILTARSRLLAAVTTIGVLTLATASATTPVSDPSSVGSNVAVVSGQGNAVRVYIDPKTGKQRGPTEEERADAAKQDAASAKQFKSQSIKLVPQPNGMNRGTDREGLLMESVVATKNADGTLSFSYEGGDGSTANPAAPAAKLEEK